MAGTYQLREHKIGKEAEERILAYPTIFPELKLYRVKTILGASIYMVDLMENDRKFHMNRPSI